MAPGSPPAGAGVKAGSVLQQINGHSIRDILDFQFYSADPIIDCLIIQDDKEKKARFTGGTGRALGFEFEPMEFASCGNRCLFCFSDQNPKGMRKSVYFKDEDYRLSFLFGNYVTLTRVDEGDLNRIVEQKLTPLYISIHAADSAVRKKLLGIAMDDRLLEKIRFLAKNGIELHGQVVLCPGINDGKVLDRTVEACSDFYPRFRSLAVVPVGLTKHRKNLSPLNRINGPSAKTVVAWARKMQLRFKKRLGEPFVYLSDEFYLLAGASFPPLEDYGDLWQSENGVGMTADFLDTFRESAGSFPKRLDLSKRLVLITGTLAGPVLAKHVLPVLNRVKNLKAEMVAVPNRFFGESVTVSGLLTGADIARSLARVPEGAVIILPSNCLNHDGVFLDDWSVEKLTNAVNNQILIVDDFASIWENL